MIFKNIIDLKLTLAINVNASMHPLKKKNKSKPKTIESLYVMRNPISYIDITHNIMLFFWFHF